MAAKEQWNKMNYLRYGHFSYIAMLIINESNNLLQKDNMNQMPWWVASPFEREINIIALL